MEEVVSFRSKTSLSRRLSLLEALFAVAMNPRARDQFRALELLMAYDFGRPRERVEMSGPGGGPIETGGKARRMTTGEMRKELEAIEQRRRDRMAKRPGAAPPPKGTGIVELTDQDSDDGAPTVGDDRA